MGKLGVFVCILITVVATQAYECRDRGVDGWSCSQLLNFFGGRDKLCWRNGYECCKTCFSRKAHCRKSTGLMAADRDSVYSCEELFQRFGKETTCKMFTRNCCITCKKDF